MLYTMPCSRASSAPGIEACSLVHAPSSSLVFMFVMVVATSPGQLNTGWPPTKPTLPLPLPSSLLSLTPRHWLPLSR